MAKSQKMRHSKTNHNLLGGDQLYLQRARITFPILVRQAEIGRTVFYSALAEEIGIPNPRNLNYVLGSIGRALEQIGTEWGEQIPPIQCLVINKSTHLPGEGISGFLDNEQEFLNSSNRVRRRMVAQIISKIHAYPRWDDVLEYLGLSPIAVDLSEEIQRAKQTPKWGTGESEAHRKFKEWIFKNPVAIGLDANVEPIQTEYGFPSQDKVDVAFQTRNTFIGVEVKSRISGEDDIIRGLFQCVKYNALIEAEQTFCNPRRDGRVILALEGRFPHNLVSARNQLGVEVIDDLGTQMG